MIEKTLSLAIPCRADEPGLGSTLDSLLAACRSPELPSACLREILICLNGVTADRPSPPLHAVREFCARHAVGLDEIDLSSAQERSPQAEAGLRCVVLVADWRGKPRAMNALWRWARGDLLAFCDADVRVAPDALTRLYAQLQDDAQARLVAAREVPVVDARASLWSRMGALPYRFDFGNAGGRLFMIRHRRPDLSAARRPAAGRRLADGGGRQVSRPQAYAGPGVLCPAPDLERLFCRAGADRGGQDTAPAPPRRPARTRPGRRLSVGRVCASADVA